MDNPVWHDLVYRELDVALRAGFHVWDKTSYGFLMRRKRDDGFMELALVDLTIERVNQE